MQTDRSFLNINKWGKVSDSIRKYDPDPKDNDTGRMTLGFDILMKVQEAAEECKEDGKDENALDDSTKVRRKVRWN